MELSQALATPLLPLHSLRPFSSTWLQQMSLREHFVSPPASQLKHLGSDMTSSGGYFLFPFLNFPFIWFAYKANNEV